MKKLKRFFGLWSLVLVLLCSALFAGAKIPNTGYSAPTTPTQKTDLPADSGLFSLVSLSRENQKITLDDIVQSNGKSYIYSNSPVSISLHAINTSYKLDFGEYSSNFSKSTESILIEPNEDGKYPTTIEVDGKSYFIEVRNTTVNIYSSNPVLQTASPITSSASSTELESTKDGSDVITLTYTTKYTFNGNDLSQLKINNYLLYFVPSSVNFANNSEPIVNFKAFGIGGSLNYDDSQIPNEQQFSSVQIDFISNAYTELNPLYFNINYNGFIFNFMLYSKVYGSENLLFVNYIDNNETHYLATSLILDENENLVPQTSSKLYADSETFTLVFKNTGRYSIEIFDKTYETNCPDPNYFETSFYIVKESSSAFNNVYIIAQSIDDNNVPIEYIVSSSTINYNVKIAVKNLIIEGSTLSNMIEKVEVAKAVFGASDNDPIYTTYTAEEAEKLIVNGDLIFDFSEDAYYRVRVYEKNNLDSYVEFTFTIIKQAKTSMKIKTGPNEDDYEKHEATTPFKEEIIDYEFIIPAEIKLLIRFTSVTPSEETTLNKSYKNKYKIRYGMQQVSVEKVPVLDDDGNEISTSLQLKFYGVGQIDVEIEFDGEITNYSIKSTETLTFTEYGVYNVKVTDSMGTVGTYSYEIKKSLNTSAIVLIILSVLLVSMIVAFVLISRAKIKTR